MKHFEGSGVPITGASRGIGKGIAQRFASEGASLVLATNERSIRELAETFKAAGVTASSVVCDAGDLGTRPTCWNFALTRA